MKIKLTTLALLATVTFANAQSEKLTVDTKKSELAWHAEKVTGQHDGFVKIKSGFLAMENGNLTGGEFVIDMPTITCTDIEDPEWNTKLIGHLKSDDFFSVEKHKTAKLIVTKAIPQGENSYKLIGNMTIKGITKEVKFMAKVTNNNGIVEANAEITLDRTEFDIRYGSGSFFDDLGDKTIYDNFEMKVSLVAGSGKKA